MSIGSTIKRLRREKDITQEQLAEYLGITSRAVSQWECDRTMPDISQLPALCNLFDISSDELLEIDIQQKEKRIRNIRAEAESYDSRGYKKEAYDILERGLREFPNSYAVMSDLMHESFYLMYDESYSESERNKYKSNAIYFGEQILEKSLNDDLRYSAIQTLCMIYSQNNEQDRARELAKKLPTMVTSREFMNPIIFKGSEGYRCDKKLIDSLINALVDRMSSRRNDDAGKPFYSESEYAALRDKTIAFISLMYEDSDFGFCNTRLADLHMSQANYYAALSDREKTIYHLSQAARFAIDFIKHTKEKSFVHTSLLLRGYETCGSSFISSESDNDASLVLNDLASPKYDFVRNEPEYDEIVKMLKEYAGKWDTNS